MLATSDGMLSLYGLERIGVQQGAGWYYPQQDALGSVRQWTDASKAVTAVQAYGPFGEPRGELGMAPWGYTGEWQDPTGLVYLRARWYNPALGQFTQVDPFPGALTNPATRHPYLYGLANPLRYTDPSGHFILVTAAVGLLVGGVMGAGATALPQMIRNVREGQSLTANIDLAEVGRNALIGMGAGFVGGLTFGVGLAAGGAIAGALGITSASGAAATAVGVTTVAVSGVAAGQTSRLTANVLRGDSPTEGLFRPQDMAMDAAFSLVSFKVFGGNFNKIAPPPEETDLRKLLDWSTYPQNPKVPKPEGRPLRLLDCQEYEAARKAADAANRAIHEADPSLKGLQIHEIHPVKWGGSPTDPANKVALSRADHTPFIVWWNTQMRIVQEILKRVK